MAHWPRKCTKGRLTRRKDYGLEASDLNVCPHLGTVTYVSETGGPTLVVDKTLPLRPSQEGAAGSCGAGFLSWPKTGKHMVFDGRFLHGAPSELARPPGGAGREGAGRTRYTFLVNVWLNHRPTDAEPAPAGLVEGLGSAARGAQLCREPYRLEPYGAAAVAVEPGPAGGLRRHAWGFDIHRRPHRLERDLPPVPAAGPGSAAEADFDSLQLDFSAARPRPAVVAA